MSCALSIQNLTCQYDTQTVLESLSLNVEHGEIVCLLGASGCGKTTLLKAIAGLLPLSDGEILIAGDSMSRAGMTVAPEHRHLGMIFQDYALFPHLTVEQNVGFGLHGQPKAQIRAAVAEMLALVRLDGLEKRFPHELSGGQQQRVALARALAPSPSLLLLDEPMSALDARVREHLCTELRQLQRQLGITTLMVTHNQDEAMLMADRIAVMNNGQVEQYATPQEIYDHPATPFVAEFVGQGNWLPFQRSSDNHAQVGDMNMRLAPGSSQASSGRLFCRPEAITVNPVVHEENLFPAMVAHAAREGSPLSLVLLDIDFFKRINDEHGHAAGDRCLQQFAERMRQVFRRDSDALLRLGGEEFGVLMPGTTQEQAVQLGESFRAALAREGLTYDGHTLPMTTSLGVGCFDPQRDASAEAFFKRVDDALYRAKSHGRDRVETA